MDILTQIIKDKQSEIAKLKHAKSVNPFARLFQSKATDQGKMTREAALRAFSQSADDDTPTTNGPIIIAEIKLKSPSGGELFTGDPIALATAYEAAGADAISVVTDEKYFGGTIELLKKIRAAVKIPILRKDFIIDDVQVVESFEAGADAVLLIAAAVDERKLGSLIQLANALNVTPIVEVYAMAEIRRALNANATIIAVNARDLRTMDTDLDHAIEVLQIVPPHIPKILFSGVTSPEDLKKALAVGAVGALVGTSLLKSDNLTEAIKLLKKE